MRAVIIVPWRAGVEAREKAWQFARPWWERFGYPIYEVEHAGTDPFNRAWCLNEGARRAGNWDVAIMIDADVLEDTDEQVTQGVIRAWETGAFTVPHSEGRDLNQEGTDKLYAGQRFDWYKHTAGRLRKPCNSRVNIIRADLFERVGGFDERFQGWGHEDVAFTVAVTEAGGQIERIPGSSWHLWHPKMLGVSKATAEWHTGLELQKRYEAARSSGGWEGIETVLAERGELAYSPPMRELVDATAQLAVLTAGRREYLERTLASAEEMIEGKIADRVIFDDSGEPRFRRWLDQTYGDRYTIISNDANLGYTEAMRRARAHIGGTEGAPYVFWLEEDFTFDRTVCLNEMATLLENRELAQVVLLRRPYYPPEQKAGGIPNQHPRSYARKQFREVRYLEHTRFYSSNPNLAHRSLYDVAWPDKRHSETEFGSVLSARGLKFAFLGWGEPWISHIGAVRVGGGY